MALDILAWQYTDDFANVYTRGVAQYVAAQVDGGGVTKIGGTITTGLQQETVPIGVKPRTVAAINAAGTRRRRVVIMTTTAPLWAGTSTTIDLRDGAGVSSTYTVYSRTGERRRTRAPGQ